MWDEGLDRAINDVAREMTAGEPHGDLRARVMTRINVADARLTPSRSWRAAFAMAAIALIALVAYRAMRPVPSTVRLRPDTTTDVRRPGPVGPGEPSGRGPGTDELGTTMAGPKGPALRPRRLVIPPSPIDALAPPPLAIAPLAIDDLDTDSLDLQPLDTIAPIAVAPLGQGDRP